MGGFGSGRRWSNSIKVDDCRCLDINRLVKMGAILKSGVHNGLITWTDGKTGKVDSSISYASNTTSLSNQYLNLSYTFKGDKKAVNYDIQLSQTKPHYGGSRFWYICPVTNKRVTRLYLPYGGDLFASRHAYNLAYASQSEGQHDRALRKKWKMLERFNDRFDLPERPKGMHQKTHDRMLKDYQRQETICNIHLINACRHFGFDTSFLRE